MKKQLLPLLVLATTLVGLVGCSGKKDDPSSVPGPSDSTPTEPVKPAANAKTAEKVAYASTRTYEELVELSREEMTGATDTFKVLGLTSMLKKAVEQLIAKYDFLTADNTYVNNGYKDYTLLTALEPAANTYVADFALTQDERSIADYQETGILHNFVPSDYKALGLAEEDVAPLKGIHFNKIFWTNTNFETVTGKKLYNIWQVAGTSEDADHLAKVSFQSPVTEQINMSFLLSCYAEENQARIEKAYKDYYKKDWSSTKYASAGEQWVTEFIENISRVHPSDGTAMKETQLKDDWAEGYVYFGAYSKMKDAAGKYYAVAGQDTDPILKDLVLTEGDNAGKINAMKTVKWDWEINGFNGYFYTMDSQIVNNAKFPYTACLFARYLLEPEFYSKTAYSSSTPNADGSKGNQYGYYYPGKMDAYGTEGAKVVTNSFDWTKTKWKEVSLVEDFDYLATVKFAKITSIQAMFANKK